MSLVIPSPSNYIPPEKRNYIGKTNSKSYEIIIEKEQDWPGKLYPEYKLMNDADYINSDADWNKQHELEDH